MINLVSDGQNQVALDRRHLDPDLAMMLNTGKCGQKFYAEPSTAMELLGSGWHKIHIINTIFMATQG